MTVETRVLAPHRPKIRRPLRDLDTHQPFNPLTKGRGVRETADTADTLREKHKILIIAAVHQALKPAVDIPDRRDRRNDTLVFHDQIQMDRFGKHRVLGSERDDRLSAGHSFASLTTVTVGAGCSFFLNGYGTDVLMNVPPKSRDIPSNVNPYRSWISFSYTNAPP